jgi:sugar phosphate isomerase/epimerase
MNESWKAYMRLGINHHLLFPASFESVEAHYHSLPEVLGYSEFEAVDMFVPDEGELGRKEVKLVLASGKEPIYNCPLMMAPDRNPHSPDPDVRSSTLKEVITHLLRARKIGARKAVIASGINPDGTLVEEQTAYFVDYVLALCQAVPDMDILIEPFDQSIGKNLLIGPTREAAAVIRKVHERGQGNAGLLIDMGHIPLMEETFTDALREAKPYVRHIHLGSCVMSNPANPLYGDMHPPWGYVDGSNDLPELIEFLKQLFAIGYLGGKAKPTVTLEMRPYPGLTERQSVDVFLSKLDEAWRTL